MKEVETWAIGTCISDTSKVCCNWDGKDNIPFPEKVCRVSMNAKNCPYVRTRVKQEKQFPFNRS
jgi:hypothetical protein